MLKLMAFCNNTNIPKNPGKLNLLPNNSFSWICLFINKAPFFYRKSKSWVKDALSYKSWHTTINIVSVCFGVWAAVSLLIGYLLEGDNVAGYEALPILTLIVINVALELYDNRLRHNEIPNRVRSVLNKLKKEINSICWTADNYPHLCSPLSPCITLQWTYRDNKLVNLPWALLVKDDIILMRPGTENKQICSLINTDCFQVRSVLGTARPSRNTRNAPCYMLKRYTPRRSRMLMKFSAFPSPVNRWSPRNIAY